ncbi:MAG: cation diffusion facilitator family transporter [Thermoproteota archaeon]
MHREPPPSNGIRNLALALAITFSFFVLELVGATITNSLSLLTDAWHMLNDVFSLFFAMAAAWLAQRPANPRRTYGYYRAEVLAGLFNGILLWGVVIYIFYQAFQRFQQPVEVQSLGMLIIALLGLVANGLSALVLSRSKEGSMNVKGAFLHVMADTLGSIGAISAGIIIYFTSWYQIDPIVSILIGVLIFYTSGRLIFNSINVLLEGAPPQIDVETLKQKILKMEGVKGIHDLHVWCITPTTMCCMSAHIVIESEKDRKDLTTKLIRMLKREFGIDHPTLQLETEGYPKAPDEH